MFIPSSPVSTAVLRRKSADDAVLPLPEACTASWFVASREASSCAVAEFRKLTVGQHMWSSGSLSTWLFVLTANP